MATSADFAEHVLEQLGLGKRARVRKMFGEYALYCDEKTVALICDNELFLKTLPEIAAQCHDLPLGEPYPKAKPHFKANALLDDPERLRTLVEQSATLLPPPKPKKK